MNKIIKRYANSVDFGSLILAHGIAAPIVIKMQPSKKGQTEPVGSWPADEGKK
jgi:hypothetical protein